MGRQINEPVIVGSSVETYPDVLSRECCVNCEERAENVTVLDKRFRCRKHRRITFAWWWCSDYLSETEALLRDVALALGEEA